MKNLKTAREAYKADPFLKVSIYGPSGVGKTEWACTAPRPLIAVTEPQAMATIASRNPDAILYMVNTFEDFRELFNALKVAPQVTLDDGQPALNIGDGVAIQTLVVDSGTDLQRMMMARMLGFDSSEVDALDFDAATKNLSLQQWGRLMDACTQIWRDQRSLRCNTVFVHLADTQLDDENRRLVVPMLYGKKLPFQIGQYFNAQGLVLVHRDSSTGVATHAIRWVADSTRYQCKPAPGWPAVIKCTQTPGETSLGSLALYSAPAGLTVPHADGDDAAWVAKSLAAVSNDPDGSAYNEPAAPPTQKAETQKSSAEEPARRRRRA